jgi:hypothetical protein
MSAPPATAPKTVRVRDNAGASKKAGVLNVYSGVKLNATGELIVELASYYPKTHEIYVTSGMDGNHGPKPNGSYHYGHLKYNGSPAAAADFGAYDQVSTAEGDRRMRDLARWFEDVIPGAADIVELIHTTPFADDNGFYVKNGQRIPGFGAETDDAHRDHVHLALSRAQVTRALVRAGAKPQAPGPWNEDNLRHLWHIVHMGTADEAQRQQQTLWVSYFIGLTAKPALDAHEHHVLKFAQEVLHAALA